MRAWGWDGGGGAIPPGIKEELLHNPDRKQNDVQDGFDSIVEITVGRSP